MPKPFTRYGPRCSQFVRQWKVLVLLRRRPHTLSMLSRVLECSERTIRRDLQVLESVPMPIYTVGGYEWGDSKYYKIGPLQTWPKGSEAPISEVQS